MEKLYKELEEAGFAPEWGEESDNIEVLMAVAEFDINKSAAPGFYGVKRSDSRIIYNM